MGRIPGRWNGLAIARFLTFDLWRDLNSRREIIIPQLRQAKLLLQSHLLPLRTLRKHLINVLYDLCHIRATIPRHRRLDRHKVLPVVVDGLDGRAAGMVRPERAGEGGLGPRGERAGVGSTHQDPGGVCGVRFVGWVKGEFRCGGNAYEIGDGVAEGEVFEIVAGEISIG